VKFATPPTALTTVVPLMEPFNGDCPGTTSKDTLDVSVVTAAPVESTIFSLMTGNAGEPWATDVGYCDQINCVGVAANRTRSSRGSNWSIPYE